MRSFFHDLRDSSALFGSARTFRAICRIGLMAAVSGTALGQAPPAPQTPQPDPAQSASPSQAPAGQSPAAAPAAVPTQADPAAATPAGAPATSPAVNVPDATAKAVVPVPTVPGAGAFSVQAVKGELKEDQLKQVLVGKTLYLRGGYQDNNLEFDERGRLLGHSPQGSYTLSQIQINKVKLTKRKLELQGDRYALHFLGASPYEDPTLATDRVKITPKKKSVHISFEREQVETPKKKKEKKEKHEKKDDDQAANIAAAKTAPQPGNAATTDEPTAATPATEQPSTEQASAGQPDAGQSSLDKSVAHKADSGKHDSDEKLKTTSAVHATDVLLTSLNKVFSPGIDQSMVAAMPDFWKLYFQSISEKVAYKPTDPGVLRQTDVDQKAKLVSALDPPSNEFAQANGVAGIALYHAVIGSDGKVEEVVAGRPIGFGLDESAEKTIRKAVFQPAMKDGKPVPVALDLVVSFRIYSKRTSQQATEQAATTENTNTSEPAPLPGPYTVQAHAQSAPQSQAPQSQAPQSPPSQQSPQ